MTGAGVAAPMGVQCWPTGARAVAVRWLKVNADVMAYTVQVTTPGKCLIIDLWYLNKNLNMQRNNVKIITITTFYGLYNFE